MMQKPLATFNEALVFHQKGMLKEAKAIYEQILKIQPRHFDALHLLGAIATQTQNHGLAVELIDKALAVNPNQPTAYNNRGGALKSLKRYDEALASYDHAIKLKAFYPEAYYNRGNVLQELQRFDEAIASYSQAIKLKSAYPEAWNNRANAMQKLRRFEEALENYNQAIRLRADYPEAYNNRGITLRDLKRFSDALASYDTAIMLRPDYAEAYSNRGTLLHELRQFDSALTSHDQAIKLKPDYAGGYYNRGITLEELKQRDEAVRSYGEALVLQPDLEFLSGVYLHAKMKLCDWTDLSASLVCYEADIEEGKKVTPPFPALSLIDKPELHLLASKVYAESNYPKSQTFKKINKRPMGGKIRLGYYSADFYNHATSYLMAELFEAHDTNRFELYGFSFGANHKDELHQRVSSAFDVFYDVAAKSDGDVAELSRQLGIDIAVDLKGITQGSRSRIFAEGCAPVQVNYLGYPGTMGVDYIDYVIADRILIPEANRQDFTEKIVYLPHSYQVNDSTRKISDKVFTREELGLPKDVFVFCCFNNNYKIMPATFDGWMRILNAVEHSVLWLLEDNPSASKNLRQEAEARGIAGSRLVFATFMKLDEHLARHQLADLFIDTLPCNAHTTASDALWAGLPVLTCMGRSFAARVAASLLNAIELPELITDTQDAYEAKAIELAQNADMLSEIKRKLEKNRLATPLFDGKMFTRHIEAAYEAMYARYQTGLPPADIQISADCHVTGR